MRIPFNGLVNQILENLTDLKNAAWGYSENHFKSQVYHINILASPPFARLILMHKDTSLTYNSCRSLHLIAGGIFIISLD